MSRWTDLERRFTEAYLQHANGAKAVREAGYDIDPMDGDAQAKLAYEILKRPHVKMWIDRQLADLEARYEVSEHNILRAVAAQAFGNIADFLDQEGQISGDALVGKNDMQLMAVQSFEVKPTEHGTTYKLTLKPSLPALEKLATRHRLFVESIDVSVHQDQIESIKNARQRAALQIEGKADEE